MQRIASQITLFFLSLIPGIALAENSAPEDYLANKPLVLEVRYCECLATKTDGAPSDLLPSFLRESSLLKVSVSSTETKKDTGNPPEKQWYSKVEFSVS
ncbi:hypothetical protein [Hydrocarboniclastica marina]|uniref:Uncharacterized protein n=1 Tax=Hydrocarboniclastica marina TaxID=2259620 RepID=A0A4P7XG52_9ALTE|nr:hypothetical protein [Hydrocarboniclastica marina]QCF25926.1 hypothetical protein soil367_08345 [Hydrocarboniclastica marina]